MTELRTPLHDLHAAGGASFTDFGGWQMPVRYSSDLAEHHAVREAAGLFDISHMAQLMIAGPDAAAFLDAAITADVSAIPVSRARYAMLLAEDGGIIDDLIVSQNAPGEYLVVANAGNHDAVVEALTARIEGFEATLTDLRGHLALIAVQGPAAQRILEATAGLVQAPEWAMGHDLEELPYYAVMGMRFSSGGRDSAVLVSRTGYTGEDGFELAVDTAHAAALWQALLAAGEPLGLVPCGLAARDTLRLEAGMPLYGHELSRETQPAQAGLGRIAPPKTKTADFTGRAAVERGPGDDARVLVGLRAEGRRAARAGYPVLAGEEVVGEVTSGALSPTLGFPVAMAFVDPAHREPGTVLDLDVRGTRIPATVVALPFYSRKKS
ncbi:glycine cleavage system aminomethyltransferase GcvT [Homoserinibacter sp. YIM 151385]|uniref:glycine cleavage system aminomethyltransferase GcvT n=1 Tax=Homoserinibacter sp. YIM 151385 TaxID=2985506 RepID=UPI0022F027F0|nr:glycine cleavage system aminomethyltransferase GcvT [Homoserinibacter sp. YIM 151385]WBU38110.1 glycine cleavage system aminomethyltransferase GcvT [Homoserinibacter sp. YIM 151385]